MRLATAVLLSAASLGIAQANCVKPERVLPPIETLLPTGEGANGAKVSLQYRPVGMAAIGEVEVQGFAINALESYERVKVIVDAEPGVEWRGPAVREWDATAQGSAVYLGGPVAAKTQGTHYLSLQVFGRRTDGVDVLRRYRIPVQVGAGAPVGEAIQEVGDAEAASAGFAMYGAPRYRQFSAQ